MDFRVFAAKLLNDVPQLMVDVMALLEKRWKDGRAPQPRDPKTGKWIKGAPGHSLLVGLKSAQHGTKLNWSQKTPNHHTAGKYSVRKGDSGKWQVWTKGSAVHHQAKSLEDAKKIAQDLHDKDVAKGTGKVARDLHVKKVHDAAKKLVEAETNAAQVNADGDKDEKTLANAVLAAAKKKFGDVVADAATAGVSEKELTDTVNKAKAEAQAEAEEAASPKLKPGDVVSAPDWYPGRPGTVTKIDNDGAHLRLGDGTEVGPVPLDALEPTDQKPTSIDHLTDADKARRLSTLTSLQTAGVDLDDRQSQQLDDLQAWAKANPEAAKGRSSFAQIAHAIRAKFKRATEGADAKPKPLTSTGKGAIKAYTGSAFQPINGLLRNYDPYKPSGAAATQSAVDKIVSARNAIQEHELTETVRAFRGANRITGVNLDDLDNLIGSTFQDDGFGSVSTHEVTNGWKGKKVQMEIVLPKGMKYADTRTFSTFSASGPDGTPNGWKNPDGEHEEELLLPEGVQYTILGYSTRPNGQIDLLLRAEMPPESYTPPTPEELFNRGLGIPKKPVKAKPVDEMSLAEKQQYLKDLEQYKADGGLPTPEEKADYKTLGSDAEVVGKGKAAGFPKGQHVKVGYYKDKAQVVQSPYVDDNGFVKKDMVKVKKLNGHEVAVQASELTKWDGQPDKIGNDTAKNWPTGTKIMLANGQSGEVIESPVLTPGGDYDTSSVKVKFADGTVAKHPTWQLKKPGEVTPQVIAQHDVANKPQTWTKQGNDYLTPNGYKITKNGPGYWRLQHVDQFGNSQYIGTFNTLKYAKVRADNHLKNNPSNVNLHAATPTPSNPGGLTWKKQADGSYKAGPYTSAKNGHGGWSLAYESPSGEKTTLKYHMKSYTDTKVAAAAHADKQAALDVAQVNPSVPLPTAPNVPAGWQLEPDGSFSSYDGYRMKKVGSDYKVTLNYEGADVHVSSSASTPEDAVKAVAEHRANVSAAKKMPIGTKLKIGDNSYYVYENPAKGLLGKDPAKVTIRKENQTSGGTVQPAGDLVNWIVDDPATNSDAKAGDLAQKFPNGSTVKNQYGDEYEVVKSPATDAQGNPLDGKIRLRTKAGAEFTADAANLTKIKDAPDPSVAAKKKLDGMSAQGKGARWRELSLKSPSQMTEQEKAEYEALKTWRAQMMDRYKVWEQDGPENFYLDEMEEMIAASPNYKLLENSGSVKEGDLADLLGQPDSALNGKNRFYRDYLVKWDARTKLLRDRFEHNGFLTQDDLDLLFARWPELGAHF